MTAPSSSSPTVADWAKFYSLAGWRSFPVWAGEKRPIYAGWPAGATTDPELIGRYFSDPNRNIGIVTGEQFDAWDIEVEHVPAFAAWLTENQYVLPEAPIAQTGRGGIHILTQPTGVNGTRYLYLNGTHIGELKSTGGFILVCPSETEQMYRWTWLPDNLAVQPAPDWLCGLLERPKTGVRLMPSRVTAVAEIKPRLEALGRSVIAVTETHQRNDYLFWAMHRAVEEGIPVEIAQEALLSAYLSATLPSESPVERRLEGIKTIESALSDLTASA